MSKRTSCTAGIIILSLIIALFTAPYVDAAEAGNGDALLTMLPDDCVFCLRINDFTASLGKLDQYLAGASPIPVSLAMMVNMQLGAAIGDPMLTGIDQGGDFAVFAIGPQGDEMEPVVGLLIPVTDYKTFVQANANCTAGEDGVAILSPPNSPMGSFALSEAGDGKYALVVPEFEKTTLPALTKAIKSDNPLGSGISAAQTKQAVSSPAWAYVNLAGLYDKYNEDALAALETARQEMNRELQAAPGGMAGVAGMMDFYFEMLPEILEEIGGGVDSATVALTPEPTILNLDIALRAKDGSEFAEVFIKNPKATGSYTMAGYLDDNNAVNAMAKMNIPSTKKMYDMIFDIIDDSADDSEFKEQFEVFKESLDKTYDAMGDEAAFSFSYGGGTPPFKFQEIVEIKKPDVMKDYMQNSMGFANEIYKSIGIPAELKYEPGVSTYKNATIDTLTISFAESDDPNMMMMQQEIEKMYGDGLKYYMAQTPDKFYMVMGPDSEQTLKSLIDQPASAAASGDIKIAMDSLKNTPYNDFVCSINVIKLVKGGGEMMGSMGAQPGMEQVARMFSGLKDVQTQSCLAVGGSIADGQAAVRLAIPKQHLIEIVTAAMQLQQQAMATMQPQMQEAPTDSPITPQPQKAPKSPLSDWIGKPAPELKMVDLDGKAHRISRLKGKKVALDFWATWCPPCKKAIPDLIKLAGSNSSDLVILGLSDEPADTLAAFVKEAKINYPIIRYDNTVPAPYSKVTAIPTLFLIDSEGIIRDVLVGHYPLEELQKRLNAMK